MSRTVDAHGFAFGTEVTALAPELRDWYGGPGVDTGNPTELFLIGDHFSVHETSVIVGNKSITPTIVSRQVPRVLIPKGVRPLQGKTYIEARVATPYGVSAPVLIPVVTGNPPAPSGFNWDPETIVMYYDYDADGHFALTGVELADPKTVTITTPSDLQAVKADLDLAFATVKGADVSDNPKFTLKNVPFQNGTFFIASDPANNNNKYPELIEAIKPKFRSFFAFSGKPADDVVVSVKIKIDGRTDGPSSDNTLTFILINRPADDVIAVPPPPAPGGGPAAAGPTLPKTSLRARGHVPLSVPSANPSPMRSNGAAAIAFDLPADSPVVRTRKAVDRPYATRGTTSEVRQRDVERRSTPPSEAPPRIIPAQYTDEQ